MFLVTQLRTFSIFNPYMREYAIIVGSQELQNWLLVLPIWLRNFNPFQLILGNFHLLSSSLHVPQGGKIDKYDYFTLFIKRNIWLFYTHLSIESSIGIILLSFATTCLIFLLPQPYFGLSMFLRYNLLRWYIS